MKLSIITINRNNAEGIRMTMESIFSQTYRDFEYIVVDGASTDGSIDIIKPYALQAEGLDFKWISEPDTGIYNAMNKGIEVALGRRVIDAFNRSTLCGDKNKGNNRSKRNGDKHSETDRQKGTGVENKAIEDGYVLMLNSGDYLVDEHVIERIMPELDGVDIVQGNLIKMDDEAEVVCRGVGKSDITFIDVIRNHFLHQASFCKKTLFDQYGYFDESYRINGDTVFYAKCLGFGNATFKYVDQDIAYYDNNGISADSNIEWKEIRQDEDKRYELMYSKRMWNLIYKEEKKINLYNKLHAHKWSWNLTMVIAHMVNWLYKDK